MDNMINVFKRATPFMSVYSVHEPIIICGCHGGGTSYITKLLRWSGFFAGADAGPITNRKLHESHIFTTTNELILRAWLGNDVPQGMRTTEDIYWNSYFQKLEDMNSMIEQAKSVVDLWRIERKYWGIYRPTDGFIKNLKYRKIPWGWKDPRNSLTLPFWLHIYPSARVLVIIKNWEPNTEGVSGSGNWFKTKSTEKVRNIYMFPPTLNLKNTDHFFFNFDEGIRDINKLNELLTWLGLNKLNPLSYERLLNDTKLEIKNIT